MRDWIIVVDSDAANLENTEQILKNSGMKVTSLRSGRVFIDYVKTYGLPDIILISVDLHDISGFETLRLLKEEMLRTRKHPLVFLMGEENSNWEMEALRAGAMDYIKKPIDKDTLVPRIQKILEIQKKMLKYEKEAETDPLTGLWNKTVADARAIEFCQREEGLLCVLDLDYFKPINDLFGHDIGDRVLAKFAELLKEQMKEGDECGRIGGDEFLLFSSSIHSNEELIRFTDALNTGLIEAAEEIMGKNLIIPFGVSIGAVSVPEYGTDYQELFHYADMALYFVKQNGKHGCRLYSQLDEEKVKSEPDLNLDAITAIMEERNDFPNAMWMGKEVFSSIYRYMVRYMDRYHRMSFRVLFTLKVRPSLDFKEKAEIIMEFRRMIQSSLRSSDVMMEVGEHQLFLLLPEVQEYDIERVIQRLLKNWNNSIYADQADVITEYGPVQRKVHGETNDENRPENWIVIADDEKDEQENMAEILSQFDCRVTCVSSGKEVLGLIGDKLPSLLLLDANMPDMDGFETMRRMRRKMVPGHEVPVILLTGENHEEEEKKAFALGAMECIQKPVVAEVLVARVRHTIELVSLERNVSTTVERKTRENGDTSMQVLRTLADAIDAKNLYSKGHSDRVAEYARKIAERAGLSLQKQDEIYLMGLLHDVGKISIPDSIINKPGKLTEEEYDLIKTHCKTGSQILRNIDTKPMIEKVARWHHERFDGTGYPDGLKGDSIPEQARIVSVADAYDAMTSPRSYRPAKSQEEVRKEIELGKGTQFDPRFADIMLELIDEDTDFNMREK